MNPILTEMSVLNFDKRDAAINQASSLIDLMKSLGVHDQGSYREATVEVLGEVLPKTGTSVNQWNIDVQQDLNGGGGPDAF